MPKGGDDGFKFEGVCGEREDIAFKGNVKEGLEQFPGHWEEIVVLERIQAYCGPLILRDVEVEVRNIYGYQDAVFGEWGGFQDGNNVA